MIYKTRDFGPVELEDDKILTFVQPILGFETYKKYALLHDDELGVPFTWLQSLEEPGLCFILADPAALRADYAPRLPATVAQTLGDGDCGCWVITAIPQNPRQATANLKSPVVVNPATRRGMQVVLDQDWPMRQPLWAEGEASC